MDVLIIRRPVPIIGTNEVRDQVGMVCVLQTLDALRRKVKFQDQLQWESMNRTSTWYNNARKGEFTGQTKRRCMCLRILRKVDDSQYLFWG